MTGFLYWMIAGTAMPFVVYFVHEAWVADFGEKSRDEFSGWGVAAVIGVMVACLWFLALPIIAVALGMRWLTNRASRL